MPNWVSIAVDHVVILGLLILAAAVTLALWVMTYPETPYVTGLCYAGESASKSVTLPVFGNQLCMVPMSDYLVASAAGGLLVHTFTFGAGAALKRLATRD